MQRFTTTYRVRASSMLAARTGGFKPRERASQMVEPARRLATDRRVRTETRRAKAHASRAAHRAQRVGIAKALGDKCVARNLRKSASHAARAASLAIHPRPSHRLRNTTLVVVGGGAASAAAYGGWKRYFTSAAASPSTDGAAASGENVGTSDDMSDVDTTPRDA